MNTLVGVLQALNVFCGAVLVGGMVMEFMLILPTQRRIPAADAARAFRIMSPIAWRYLPPFGALTAMSAIAIVILARDVPDGFVVLMIAGLVCFGLAMVTNLGFYLRTDRAARAWTPDGGDAAFDAHLERMGRLHTIRMVLFVTAYACFVVAAVLG